MIRRATEATAWNLTSEKLDVELPAKVDKKPQKLIDAMNEATPEEFESTYAAQQQVRAHGRRPV